MLGVCFFIAFMSGLSANVAVYQGMKGNESVAGAATSVAVMGALLVIALMLHEVAQAIRSRS
jgi:hypothetical protein